MPLSKSKGNMYPWVTHTHTHLGGECPHACNYCYVQAIAKRFSQPRYTGELKLIESELGVRYGNCRIIFIEHCNDLWADSVPKEWIEKVLEHCNQYPGNKYVFQTKNPARYRSFLDKMPKNRILGCTIETDDEELIRSISAAPPIASRVLEMSELSEAGEDTFITIEPILACDGWKLAGMVANANPSFVNIGADSKGIGLQEPSKREVLALISWLNEWGVEIRQKSNLDRLLK